MNETKTFFAACPKGLEAPLHKELNELGAASCRETVAGVYFYGDINVAYRACLWSRLSNKILFPIEKFDVKNNDSLYDGVANIAWETHFSPSESILVDFIGTNDRIRNTQFGAQKAKDAIADRLRDQFGERPRVDKSAPDIRINIRLAKNVAHVSLDLSGESLHRRGYRQGQGGAPLKENLAAVLLYRAGWQDLCQQGASLIDPMCGSATILIEGAMIATDMAPGLTRARRGDRGFGFAKWKLHQSAEWSRLVAEAEERFKEGMANSTHEIRGYDSNPRVLDAAQDNIAAAELDGIIRVSKKDMREFKKPTHKDIADGLMLCNPPYGERLGEIEALKEDYQTLARVVKQELPGWTLGVFTGNAQLGSELRLRPKKKYKLFNGTIPSELLLYDIVDAQSATLRKDENDRTEKQKASTQAEEGEFEASHEVYKSKPLSDGAQMVANRLLKNKKRLAKWIKKENIECYRLYDADMPEYAAAIDIYGNDIHIQEYAAPKSIDPAKAEYRFDELLSAAAQVFEKPIRSFYIKTRKRNRGKEQYTKMSEGESLVTGTVREGMSQFLVNFTDYLDTGLFLDHRPLRKRIAEEARGKHFLNLFCYTATATVHAAVGGAASSTSVDMSKTYLSWAKQNFQLNNINLDRHELVQGDCLNWLKSCRKGFDLIMLDPPSFSNSKRMEGVLDIQRDHVTLVKRCMELLNPGGTLYFSNNLRSFKLDQDALSNYHIDNISQQTLDPDFKQNPKIHYCWKIQHGLSN